MIAKIGLPPENHSLRVGGVRKAYVKISLVILMPSKVTFYLRSANFLDGGLQRMRQSECQMWKPRTGFFVLSSTGLPLSGYGAVVHINGL